MSGEDSMRQALLEIMEPEINEIVGMMTKKTAEKRQKKWLGD